MIWGPDPGVVVQKMHFSLFLSDRHNNLGRSLMSPPDGPNLPELGRLGRLVAEYHILIYRARNTLGGVIFLRALV